MDQNRTKLASCLIKDRFIYQILISLSEYKDCGINDIIYVPDDYQKTKKISLTSFWSNDNI